jgi:hypothetical protein
MKLIKEEIKIKIPVIKPQPRVKREGSISRSYNKPKKYLYTVECLYNTVDAIIIVTDVDSGREIEKRYCKVINRIETTAKVINSYKKVNELDARRVLTELKEPKSAYVPVRSSVKEYSHKSVTEYSKFQDCFQQLISCLDDNLMRVTAEYTRCGDGCYKIDLNPLSNNLAKGLHRVKMDIERQSFKYFYGKDHVSLKLICETSSISKLFNDEG